MADAPLPPGPVGLQAVSPPPHPTAQLAQALPGYDPAPVINAGEQDLADYLNTPVNEILARLGVGPLPSGGPMPGEAGGGGGSPFDPGSLIQPVTDALGTLGTGVFDAMDPTKLLEGVSKTFESTASSLQQAMGSMMSGFQGATGAASGGKTAAAIGNGAEVGAQSSGIGASASTAAADVKQAETRMLEIIHQWEAEMASLTPGLPWTAANIMEASTRATTMATEVMTELQSSLTAQGGAVSAIGAPVSVTSAPQMGAQMIGPMVQMATGLISPLMSVGTQGISTVVGGIQKAAQTGMQVGTKMASSLGKSSSTGAGAKGVEALKSTASGSAGALGRGIGGGAGHGGGGGASTTLAARTNTPMPSLASESSTASGSAVRGAAVSSAGTSGGVMGGGGAMGAGAAGAGRGGESRESHAAASYLTAAHSEELLGDPGVATPAVIGEAGPHPESPDKQLTI
ncbi:hypothetical protein [Mycobacteroides abscessus]|uniref:hypothetical protein n=1 Tax=Mycobacteroides abscessus TaxID=36809 RepID=UPI0002D995B1|nr:hypothetical protein [Mycobacteroides abscessus]MBN7442433.1 hypothetical protein [Mycobacteroides abscessus subsp. abscessus]MDM2351040.1 hypothetical protein [Mycobacteroides abscessus]MDM2360958.1 hypothetical protein [Mycobacteroides abscessus]MDO3104746.1 hypothetical protein [Mycobacteroides abscessus subsp. abscessus]QOF27050.1 hypothetical protein E3G43_000578 [Mycobacteroides abscessus]